MKKLVLFALLFTAACGPFRDIPETPEERFEKSLGCIIGEERNTLLEIWGAPTTTYQINEHEEAFVYDQISNYTQQKKYRYYCNITFILKNGIVKNWSYRGDNCVPPLDSYK